MPESQRVAVALKVDEAPLVLNRGFAETMALKRSAGLETVAGRREAPPRGGGSAKGDTLPGYD